MPHALNDAAAAKRARLLCLAVALFGLCILFGWLSGLRAFMLFAPMHTAAKANTAIGMTLLALATALTLQPRPRGARFTVAYLCIATTMCIALITLAEYALDIDLGIDELLVRDTTPPDGSFIPGRVPRVTALGFMLLGTALVAQVNTARRSLELSRVLVWITLVLAAQAFVTYIVNAQILLGRAVHTQMSIHSTAMFVALCAALLLGQRLLRDDGDVDLTARDARFQVRLLVVAAVVPPAVQSFLQMGQRIGWLTQDVGTTTQVTANSVLLLIVIHVSLSGLRDRTAQVQKGERRFAQLAEEFKAMEREKAQLDAERVVAHAARVNEERLETLLEGAFDAVISIDAREYVIAWNGKAELMFGRSKAETLAQPLSELIVPPDLRAAHLEGLRQYHETGEAAYLHREIETRACRADGSVFPVRMFITPVKVDGNTTFTAFISDITARKHAEDALRQAQARAEQAAAAKSQFLAHMSHEIRTPLNGVLGVTDILLDAGLTTPQKKLAEVLRGAGQQLLHVVNDILDLSKSEAGQLSLESITFDLRYLIHQSLALLQVRAEEKHIELIGRIAEEIPLYVVGDPARLGQVLLNLLSNAIKFTERGSVTLTVSTQGAALRFTVRDTGMGMAPEVMSGLFSPFYQADSSTSRRFGGTGLGLAISQQLVGLMGGRVEVASIIGEGSSFWFDIVLKANTERPAPAKTPEVQELRIVTAQGRAPTILVAEDNAVNQLVVLSHLEKLGCEATLVGNGREVVETFKTQRFDMVMMDCHMPEMDGFAATRAIRSYEAEQGGHTPIVALTASALADDVAQCLRVGMDAHLCKPLGLKTLADMIRKVLDQSPV